MTTKEEKAVLSREQIEEIRRASNEGRIVTWSEIQDLCDMALSRPAPGWVSVSKDEAARLVREDGAFQVSGTLIFIRQRDMGQEWFRFDSPDLSPAPGAEKVKP